MKRLILEKSKDEFYTSHSGLALAGLAINHYGALVRRIYRVLPKSAGIEHGDILRSYLGLLCLGKSDYEAISAMKDDMFFQESLGVREAPSAPTLRQRMDEHAVSYRSIVEKTTIDFLKAGKASVSPLSNGMVPLDIDVFPMDNSDTRKEGVARTYHGYDGYAPVASYLGLEGWCLEIELRPGSQHSQKEFIPYLDRILDKARCLTSRRLLVRLDSAHDALDTLMSSLRRTDNWLGRLCHPHIFCVDTQSFPVPSKKGHGPASRKACRQATRADWGLPLICMNQASNSLILQAVGSDGENRRLRMICQVAVAGKIR